MSRIVCAPRRGRAGNPWAACVVWGMLCVLAACRSTSGTHRESQIEPAACAAFADALRALREPDLERSVARERARSSCEQALAIHPGWIPPRRVLDDLQSEELVGVVALRSHLQALAEHGEDPGELYLAGRLEGADGERRFERSVRLDPSFAWGHHGCAWNASRAGRNAEAVRCAERALALAESPWERAFFSASLARFLDASDRSKDAVRELERRLEDEDLSDEERASLRYELVRLDLKHVPSPRAARAHEAGLELLREALLSEAELRMLCQDLRLAGTVYDPRSLDLDLALASQPSAARDRIRAELLMESAPTPLAQGLLDASYRSQGLAPLAGRGVRVARFAAGDFSRTIEAWLAALPRAVCDAEGLPNEPRLKHVVECGRALATASAGSDQADRMYALAQALIDAGWFREARSVSDALAAYDLPRALEVHARATAGLALIEDWSRLARGSDALFGSKVPSSVPDASQDVSSLLAALAVRAAEAHVWLGGTSDPVAVEESFARSPRIDYGPIGVLVHPGPVFSVQDQAQGLGQAGARVPGFAEELDRLGRFGLLGQVLGDREPDATILPKLWIEFARGEHLGIAWSGTVAWCESPDLDARVARRGAEIAAAALHEGYWIDVDALRREQQGWMALRREFSGEGGAARVERALAVSGIHVGLPDLNDSLHERALVRSLLGEARRVRLAVLRDRGRELSADEHRAGEVVNGLGIVDLDEIAAATAVHEQGHLCDRTRFFPIAQHLPQVFLFLLDSGFSPRGVGERLESRAQLVCICDAADPRLPLAQVLDAAEDVREGVTPHTRAYAGLAAELVAELSRDVARSPADYPEIDPEATLVHQLHRLPPEKIRHVAMLLAHKKRMLREVPRREIGSSSISAVQDLTQGK